MWIAVGYINATFGIVSDVKNITKSYAYAIINIKGSMKYRNTREKRNDK